VLLIEVDGLAAGLDADVRTIVRLCQEAGARVLALQLQRRLVHVDDAVEQREDVGAKVRHVPHRPVVRVERREQRVHPPGVDERPGHERQEVDLRQTAPIVCEQRQIGTDS